MLMRRVSPSHSKSSWPKKRTFLSLSPLRSESHHIEPDLDVNNFSSISSSIEIDVTHQNTESCTHQNQMTSSPIKNVESSTKITIENDENAQSVRRILLLVIVVMVHNIPEGMASGVAFGSIGQTESSTVENAFKLAIAISLHNFPEGLAVSLPLVGLGWPKWKAFLLGQFSGILEPLATLPAAFGVMMLKPLLPYVYSFAAGAMIYVVFDDLMPEAHSHGNGRIASLGAMIGFIVMMILEIGLASFVDKFKK
jgi:zinc transporter ZupT